MSRGLGDVYKRQVYVSVYVCCTHLFSFFPLAFVLVNDLSLVSGCFFVLEMRTILFLLPFVSFCCMHLYFMSRLLPCLTRCSFIDVLSCTPIGVSEIKTIDLT